MCYYRQLLYTAVIFCWNFAYNGCECTQTVRVPVKNHVYRITVRGTGLNQTSYVPIYDDKHYTVNDLAKNSVVETADGNGNCSGSEQSEIRKCSEPLYASGMLRPTNKSFEFSWNYLFGKSRDFLANACESFLKFDLCIEPYKDSCFTQEPTRTRYQAAVAVLHFFCGNSYYEMLESMDCFSRTLARPEMLQCQAEAASDSQKLQPLNRNITNAYEVALCGAIQKYVDCMKYPIRYECGYRAWYTLREMLVRPASTLLPNCNIAGAREVRTSWTSLYDIFAGILTTLPGNLW